MENLLIPIPKPPRPRHGFTLVELLVVLGIIALLSALLLPALFSGKGSARASVCLSNMKQMHQAMAMYRADYDNAYGPAVIYRPNQLAANDCVLWYDLLHPYLKSPEMKCPEVTINPEQIRNWRPGLTSGYAMNSSLFRLQQGDASDPPHTLKQEGMNEADIVSPAQAIEFADARVGMIAINSADGATRTVMVANSLDELEKIGLNQTAGGQRHNGGGNYAFADGHTKWQKPDAAVFYIERRPN